jgi:hypothetical protein
MPGRGKSGLAETRKRALAQGAQPRGLPRPASTESMECFQVVPQPFCCRSCHLDPFLF